MVLYDGKQLSKIFSLRGILRVVDVSIEVLLFNDLSFLPPALHHQDRQSAYCARHHDGKPAQHLRHLYELWRRVLQTNSITISHLTRQT